MRVLLPLILGGVLAACASNASGPTVPLDERFTLAPGESVTVRNAPLRVQFLRVSEDSRCPADALCIQAGNAVVHIGVTGGLTAAEYELHTGDDARTSITHAGRRVRLLDVQPYPFSSLPPIQPGDYRVTLVVTS